MFHKQITVALLLSCIFVLGNSQFIFCTDQQREEQETKNLCSNLTFSIGCLCLGDGGGKHSYMFEFQSTETCEGARDELTKQNVFIGVNECPTRQLGAELNITQLETVCQADGIIQGTYQKERDLCTFEPASGRRCHHLECVTEFLPTNLCDNLTLVEENFEFLKKRNETFNESQKYIVIFKRQKQCEKTANKIRNDKFPRRFKDANGTLCYENCTRAGKYFSATLNLEGLKWVCRQKKLKRAIFEEKYINDSICRNVTGAERLFFPPNTTFENFTVVYNPGKKVSQDCESLVNGLTNPTRPDIRATIYSKNCKQRTPQIEGTLNYEALTLVCSYTDPSTATVTEVRMVTTTEESTEEPTIGIGIIG